MSVDAVPPQSLAAAPAGGTPQVDASQVDALQAELAQVRQALEDLNHAISHDLRAPLRHVRAYLQIVEEDFGEGLAPALRQHLRTVDEAAAQMARMVDALLELSRLRQCRVQQLPVDLHQLVQQARDEVAPEDAASPRVASLQWDVEAEASIALGDPELLLQVLRRLLSNAAKFTRRQSAPRVEVCCVLLPGTVGSGGAPASGAACEIRIRDNGAGFDMRQADSLYKPFQRLHAARDFEGLGAGLAYAQLALQRMGGALRIVSPGPQQGCDVVVRLPCAPEQG